MTALRALPLSAPLGAFARWQPLYADIGIPTFPVSMSMTPEGKPSKKPSTHGYSTITLAESARLAQQRQRAAGIGFMAEKAGVTVLDVDSNDPALLDLLQDRFGQSRFIVQTATGKWHAYYRHNGEGRLVRPEMGVSYDVLGAGLVIAAGSLCAIGEYRIIKGELDDLGHLTTMNEAAARFRRESPRIAATSQAPRLAAGDRNAALYRHALANAHHCDDFDALLDVARGFAASAFEDAMSDAEVVKTAASAWKAHTEGRNFVGRGEKVLAFDSIPMMRMIEADKNAWVLYSVLTNLHSGSNVPFPISDGLVRKKWAGDLSRRELRAARQALVDLGYVRRIKGHGSLSGAALFRFGA